MILLDHTLRLVLAALMVVWMPLSCPCEAGAVGMDGVNESAMAGMAHDAGLQSARMCDGQSSMPMCPMMPERANAGRHGAQDHQPLNQVCPHANQACAMSAQQAPLTTPWADAGHLLPIWAPSLVSFPAIELEQAITVRAPRDGPPILDGRSLHALGTLLVI